MVAFGAGVGAQALRTQPPPQENSGAAAETIPVKTTRRVSGGTDAERLRAASGDAVASVAKSVIRIGPQAERLRRFLSLLEGVDAGNWEELTRIMAEETSENGRFQGQEWDLMMRRIGQIDGQRAAGVFAAKGEEESLRKVLAGWAQADLDGAWKWLENYKDERGRRDIWRGALIGLAEIDPALAMRKLESLPYEVKGGTIAFLVHPLIQAEGIDATTARIKEIYADYQAKDPASISGKEHEYVYAFFHNVCDIKRNAGYTPEKRMEALETLSGFPDLARRSPWLIERTVASAARDFPERTMEVVERMTVVDGQLLDDRGVDQAAKIWQEKDPGAFKQWLEKNRGTPMGDRAMSQLPGAGG